MSLCKNLKEKKIGIWGTGIVGQATAQFLVKKNISVSFLDRAVPSTPIREFIEKNNISFWLQKDLEQFINTHDYIIPSPGIDIRPYLELLGEKLVTELDLFYQFATIPIIAITGTVGKTSVTSLLAQCLAPVTKVLVGGNIGVGTFDLLKDQDINHSMIVEVSDVQLRYTKNFAPDLAIWTNFFPNHLDWHNSLQDYFSAKCRVFLNSAKTNALVPLKLAEKIRAHPDYTDRALNFFSMDLKSVDIHKINPQDRCYVLHENSLLVAINSNYTTLHTFSTLPSITYRTNWLIIAAALDLLKLSPQLIRQSEKEYILPEHRLELVTSVLGIDFYNDSKSTIINSTICAVDSLHALALHRPIKLFLGGLSKGIDRGALLQLFVNKVDTIYCFGKEAELLYEACKKTGISANHFSDLETAFDYAIRNAHQGDIVLFSPAGSSFDLFQDYKDRGNQFKDLVHLYANRV